MRDSGYDDSDTIITINGAIKHLTDERRQGDSKLDTASQIG